MKKEFDKNVVILRKLASEEKTAEKTFKDAEKDALKYCNGKRVNVVKNNKELFALKVEFEKQKDEFQKSINGQSYDHVHHRKCLQQRLVQNLENFINCQDKNIDKVSNMIQKRRKFFVTMRSSLVRLINRDFTRLLHDHNLAGTLIPSYKYHLLEVRARPTSLAAEEVIKRNSSNSAHQNIPENCNVISGTEGSTKSLNRYSLTSLSGGERSKTLVCLINSLWSVQQPPFRCLDEWDVYLDPVARKLTEAMLVETAMTTKHQYFFISPRGSIFSTCSQDELNNKYQNGLKVFTLLDHKSRKQL